MLFIWPAKRTKGSTEQTTSMYCIWLDTMVGVVTWFENTIAIHNKDRAQDHIFNVWGWIKTVNTWFVSDWSLYNQTRFVLLHSEWLCNYRYSLLIKDWGSNSPNSPLLHITVSELWISQYEYRSGWLDKNLSPTGCETSAGAIPATDPA